LDPAASTPGFDFASENLRLEFYVKFVRLGSILFVAATLSLAGCKADKATHGSEVIDNAISPASASRGQEATQQSPSTSSAPVDTSQFGSIDGVVDFHGKPPARVQIDMSMDPACAMAGGTNMSEQTIVTGGKLANVYVYIKAGAPPSKASAGPAVVLDQKGCRYTPHVIAVQQGGSVEFRNSDPTMHNIHAVPGASGNKQLDVSEGPMGQPQTQQFNAPEVMMPIRCNNHPWMSAYLNIAPTPYFAVTGTDGKFEMHLPPGTYTLAAVHEKLGEQDQQIVVPAKGTAKTAFTFGPTQ
jgi:plastocyanin